MQARQVFAHSILPVGWRLYRRTSPELDRLADMFDLCASKSDGDDIRVNKNRKVSSDQPSEVASKVSSNLSSGVSSADLPRLIMNILDKNGNFALYIINDSRMRYYILNNDSEGPVIYWGIGQHDSNPSEIVPMIKELTKGALFRLVAFMADDWNADFSPWAAPAVFGKEAFEGKGKETLKWLTDVCFPAVESDEPAVKRFIAGYSLAGLFALWTALSTNLFNGIASCSGSLWFPKWMDFVKNCVISPPQDIYLSLGDTEEHTKNAVMSTVGDNTRETFDLINTKSGEEGRVILEWNQGGHFTNPTLRTAKGIAWLIKNANNR